MNFPHCYAITTSLGYDRSGDQNSQQAAPAAAAPIITAQPTYQIVAPGDDAGFSVTVSSSIPVTYQWQFNNANISGATGDSLLVANVSAANQGNYTVIVTNSSGSVTSSPAQLYYSSNGNGLPDSWEMQYFGNLNQTAGGSYAGDGIPNIVKFQDGLDPTVYVPFTWIAASGDFNTAANWNYNRTRAPGPGDTAIINTGTFTTYSGLISVAQLTASVPFIGPTNSNVTFTVTGSATFSGAFTLASGYLFASTGGGAVTISGPTNITGASLSVYGTNSTLTFSGLTTYTQPADFNMSWTAGQPGQDNTGCQLNFSALTTLTGNVETSGALGATGIMTITAQNGATINFSALTSAGLPTGNVGAYVYPNFSPDGLRFSALASGVISAPLLTVFNDDSNPPESSLTTDNTGTISIPELTAPYGVSMDITSVATLQQFTSLGGDISLQISTGTVTMQIPSFSGDIAITGGAQVTFSKATDINNATSINVTGTGSTLSFSKVTSFTQPAETNVSWTAGQPNQDNTGCELNFPALVSITGSIETTGALGASSLMSVVAQDGAAINFSALTNASLPTGNVGAYVYPNFNPDGIRFSAHDSGVINANVLTSFQDDSSPPESSLTSYNSGIISIPELTAPYGVSMDITSVATLQQFTSLGGTISVQVSSGTVVFQIPSLSGVLTVNGGAQVSFENVTNIDNVTSINVNGTGSILSFPAVASYTQPANTNVSWTAGQPNQDNTGCELNFPALASITGSVETSSALGASSVMSVTAQDGATINFSALLSMGLPTGDVGSYVLPNYNPDGIRFSVADSGVINAEALTSFEDNSTPPESSLSADSTGTFNLTDLTQQGVLGVTLNNVTLVSPVTFADWVSTYFTTQQQADPSISGLSATPEGDGVPNLLKYLFDINPSRSMSATDRSALPSLGLTMDRDYLTFTYREYALKNDITVTVQTSPDLKTWTATSAVPSQIGSDPTTHDPIMQVQIPVSGSKQFMRLNVTSP